MHVREGVRIGVRIRRSGIQMERKRKYYKKKVFLFMIKKTVKNLAVIKM